MALPLSGVVVLDLSRLLPGAFAALMLAELGADVIKIEDPNGGDPMRHLPPLVDGRGIYHLLLDRGKKSVTLDLRQASQRDVLERLMAGADVVIESFRPRTARRLGVDGEHIRRRHARVIHCAITGYGQTGPYAERPGHDLNYVAISGLLAADRPLDFAQGKPADYAQASRPPSLPRMFIADVGGGAMTAVVGILAALFGRERTGEGTTLDISMHDASMYWLMVPAARDLVAGGRDAVGELPTFGDHACYNVYRTKDGGQIALGALEPKFWLAFCDAVGRADLGARHLTSPGDQAALIDEVGRIFAARTRDEWLAFFRDHDVCLTPVNSPAAAFADPHAVARGVVGAVPGGRAIRPPFLREAPALAAAPTLGQDTADILGRLEG
jgi:crotonobetainyl-CoA:carnitine CoA-transferase CaiB-like acyl-CoA transferase